MNIEWDRVTGGDRERERVCETLEAAGAWTALVFEQASFPHLPEQLYFHCPDQLWIVDDMDHALGTETAQGP